MLCIVIHGPTFKEACDQIIRASLLADCVELRIDHFQMSLEEIRQLKRRFSIPMIFTLRSASQGGAYKNSELARLQEITQLAGLNPEYLDLESHVPGDYIHKISQKYSHIKMIISHHDFETTPANLKDILHSLKSLPAAYYKIAVTPHSINDALKFLPEKDPRLIFIAMGEIGHMSRIISPLIQNPITYACLDHKVAPGQIPAEILLSIYRYRDIKSHFGIYGLIGDPIDQSISHYTHNHVMKEFGIDGVYVKMQVRPHELAEFMALAKRLPFRGLSVTMPLKEAVLPYLDEIDEEARAMGSVNTVAFEQGKIKGYNTDGLGALKALQKKIDPSGKKVVLLGSGGAARAIAYELHKNNAQVIVLNRTIERAKQIALQIGCSYASLHHISEYDYDILINCTPLDMPIENKYLLPGSVIMDIKSPGVDTPFLKEARKKGCETIFGYHMFVEQALGQFRVWGLSCAGMEKVLRSVVEDTIGKIEKNKVMIEKSHHV